MGLGGYLAAKTDTEHYASELDREYRETVELPEIETEEVAKVFRDYGLSEPQMAPIVKTITANQKKWVDFMMRFELGLEQPDPARAGRSAGTIAASYIAGGLDSARAVHFDSSRYTHRADLFGRGDAASAFYFWRDQGTLHGREAIARRNADGAGGRLGGGGGVFHRAIDQLRCGDVGHGTHAAPYVPFPRSRAAWLLLLGFCAQIAEGPEAEGFQHCILVLID